MTELLEQFRVIYKGMSYSCSPQAFMRNVRILQGKYGLPRHQAMAAGYAILMWACERVAHSARAEMEKKKDEETIDVTGKFLSDDERALAKEFYEAIKAEEDGVMDDELRQIKEIDAARGKVLMEQRPVVADVVKSVEDDLKKGVLVGIARMMRDMGYDRWPRDPEGQRDIKSVIDAVARELTRMGRRFTSMMRRELNVLRRLGPERYERVMRRWLAGQPAEVEEPEESKRARELPKAKRGDRVPSEGEESEGGVVLPCPGSKIRSKGLELGLGHGRGKGPIGIPIGAKSPEVVDEQIVPEKVGEDWWREASLMGRIAALMDLAGMSRAEATQEARRDWNRLPGYVRTALEAGAPVDIPWESKAEK